MKKEKVGIFDSGIGGLGIIQELSPLFGSYDFEYYADDLHSPYGEKSEEFVLERSIEICKHFLSRGISLIVVACNTATALSIDKLRQLFPTLNFVGVEPYLNVLNKEPNLLNHDSKTIVLTTQAMGSSQRFLSLQKRLDPQGLIEHRCCPKLASLIESGFFEGINLKWHQEVLKELDFFKTSAHGQVILGCTHYSFVSVIFEKEFNLRVIDSATHIARRIFDLLGEGHLSLSGNLEGEFLFYRSSTRQYEYFTNKKLFKLNLELEKLYESK